MDRSTLPLSDAQEALWYLDRLHGPGSLYNLSEAFRITGPLDREALQRSLQAVVDRHAALRTCIFEDAGNARQRIEPEVCIDLEMVEVDALHNDSAARLEAAMRQLSERPFDLGQTPLMRARLYRLGDREHVLQIVMHHVVSDGWSLGVFFRDLWDYYGEAPRPPLAVDYAEYLRWQREQVSGPSAAAGLDWWRQRLAGLEPLVLPTDGPRRLDPDDTGQQQAVEFGPAETQALRTHARAAGVTLFTLLLAAFKVLIHRISGQSDLAVGVPMAGRDKPAFEDLIGYFVNMVVIRTAPAPSLGFDTFLRTVWDQLLEAYKYRHVPFDRIVAAVGPVRVPNCNPLFQVAFALQNTPRRVVSPPGLAFEPVPAPTSGSHFDLFLSLNESADGLNGYLEYRTDLFDDATIRHVVRQFRQVLRNILASPSVSIGSIRLSDDDEVRLLLRSGFGAHWPAVPADASLDSYCRTIAHLDHTFVRGPVPGLKRRVEEQAEQTPDAWAVHDGVSRWTYRDLNERANAIASRIGCHSINGTRGRCVAVCLGRSALWVAALLAVVKSGRPYVPLDVDSPPQVLAELIAQCGAGVVLVDADSAARLQPVLPAGSVAIIALDNRQSGEAWMQANPPGDFGRETIAYVMFTSGTTGRPKGVRIATGSVVSLVTDTDYIAISPGDRVAQASNPAFDAATFEVWGALLNGAELVVIDKPTLLSSRALEASIREGRVTTMFLNTALFNAHARQSPEIFAPLQNLLIGGEACDASAVSRVLAVSPPARLVNVYGPTETTTFAAWHCITHSNTGPAASPGRRHPIGRPLASIRCHVLDDTGRLAAVGVIGEIHIGGSGVGRDYLDEPAATAASFVDDPLVPGGRLYRSGDLGRVKADGTIDFVGRKDRQIKLRGYRIEPAEVEHALRSLPGVEQAVLTVRVNGGGERLLDACVTLAPGSVEGAASLKQRAAARLAPHAVPSVIRIVDRLPLTPNGKVDIAALTRFDAGADGDGASPETGDTTPTREEALLRRIWEDLLGHGGFGLDDNFNDVGGHSLLALRLLASIEREAGIALSPGALITAPTIRTQAVLLSARDRAPADQGGRGFVVPVQSAGRRAPLFLVPGYGAAANAYRHLASALGPDQPFHLLSPVAIDPRGDRFADLAALARAMVADLRRFRPHGPYHICGYSVGGNIAWEVACELYRQGEKSGRLILLDCKAPGYAPRRALPIRWCLAAVQAARQGPRRLAGLVRWHWRRGFRNLLGVGPPLVFRGQERAGLGPAALAVEQAWFAAYRLWKRHEPLHFPGDIHVIRSRVRATEAGVRDDDPTLGWGSLTGGRVTVLPINCRHTEIMLPDRALELAEVLRQCLSVSSRQTVNHDHG